MLELNLISIDLWHWTGNAQDDPPLKVEFFDPSDRYVRAGDEVQLDYTVNRPLIFGIMNSALMIRQRKGNGTVQSDTLADSAKLTEDGLPDFYDVDLDQDSQELTIHFKILEGQWRHLLYKICLSVLGL